MKEDEKVVTPTEARQGSARRENLRALIAALILLTIAAALLYGYFYSHDLPSIR